MGSSTAMARVDAELARMRDGVDAAALDTDGWTTHQWLHFLEESDGWLDEARMRRLDEVFAFTATENSEVLCVWLRLAVKNRYAEADERLEAFLYEVGRAKFLRPLYRELRRHDPERAAEIYELMRPRYLDLGPIKEIAPYIEPLIIKTPVDG